MILVLVVEDWRSALIEHGALSVGASLDSLMPQLCADNWRDSLPKASFAYYGLDSVHVGTSTKGTKNCKCNYDQSVCKCTMAANVY